MYFLGAIKIPSRAIRIVVLIGRTLQLESAQGESAQLLLLTPRGRIESIHSDHNFSHFYLTTLHRRDGHRMYNVLYHSFI